MNYELRFTGKIQSFTGLKAWQEGHKLVLSLYKATAGFPPQEVFGLTSQLRRAGISITSNIAEGFSRKSYGEKLQFYSMALGSLTEIQNQILIAKDVGYLTKGDFDQMAIQTVAVSKLLNGLIKKTKTFLNS